MCISALTHPVPLDSAEGGCFLKPVGKKTWETLVQEDTDMQWRKKVMEVRQEDSFEEDCLFKPPDVLMKRLSLLQMFEYYKERTPGSEIEEKTVPIVWVCRVESISQLSSDHCSLKLTDTSCVQPYANI